MKINSVRFLVAVGDESQSYYNLDTEKHNFAVVKLNEDGFMHFVLNDKNYLVPLSAVRDIKITPYQLDVPEIVPPTPEQLEGKQQINAKSKTKKH